jgi:SET domain-containing protein
MKPGAGSGIGRYKILMAFLSRQLYIRKSSIPNAGKGLFTRKKIEKGARIVEYKGKKTTWKEVDHRNWTNAYIFYIDRNRVVDAATYKKALGRYANDAMGAGRKKGLRNNAEYVAEGDRVFIDATRDIPAGAEILVDYGKEYWEVIQHNQRVSKQGKEKKPRRSAQ